MVRKCANCSEYKEEVDFPKRTGGGYQSYCILCKRLLDRENKKAKRELDKIARKCENQFGICQNCALVKGEFL